MNITPPGKPGNVIVSCNKFHTEKVHTPFTGNTEGQGFRFMMCIEGECVFRCGDFSCELKKGGNVFVPSDCESDYDFEGKGEILINSEGLRGGT